MNKLKIYGSIITLLIVLFYTFVPNYPNVNNIKNSSEMKDQIGRVLSYQSIEASREAYSGNWPASAKSERAIKDLYATLEECKDNTDCLAKAYEEYMDNWCTPYVRKISRAEWMIDKFGIVGRVISIKLGDMFY